MPGIDDAAFSFNNSRTNYSDAVDSCQRIGGKVFEPTGTTYYPVFKRVKEKSPYNYDKAWLGIIWSNQTSEFQYQSNRTRISWSNFYDTSLKYNIELFSYVKLILSLKKIKSIIIIIIIIMSN